VSRRRGSWQGPPAAGHGEEEAGPGAAGPAGPDAGAAGPRGGDLAQGAGEEADPGVVADRLRRRCWLCLLPLFFFVSLSNLGVNIN